MSEEEFAGMKDIKNLFREVLGSDVEIKDNIDATEENVFILFIEKLEKAFTLEEKTEELSGLDLTKITEGLWFVIEHSFKFLYGEESTQVFYLYFQLIFENHLHPYMQ